MDSNHIVRMNGHFFIEDRVYVRAVCIVPRFDNGICNFFVRARAYIYIRCGFLFILFLFALACVCDVVCLRHKPFLIFYGFLTFTYNIK